MSKKYILEVEDEPCEIEKGIGYFRCTEAKWWMISECTLNRLAPYRIDLAQHEYQRGLSDAWDAASRIYHGTHNEKNMMTEIFGWAWSVALIFNDYLPQEVITKLKAYDEQKSWNKGMVEVGDEVILDDGTRAVVLDTDNDSWFVMTENGCVEDYVKSLFKGKTGRHFDEVGKLIDALREDKE